MSQHTAGTEIQRTATQRVPSRTVAGSYEAPVEGIVDYGAFQRGFESTFVMPEEEEKIKLPEAFTDIDFLGAKSKTGNLGFNEIAINQYKASIEKELDKLQDEYDLAYIRHGEGSREVGKVNEKVEHLKKIVNATDLGIKTMVDAEGAFDVQQAKLNPSLQGYSYSSGERVNSPFVDLVNTKNQNKDSNFSLVIDYENNTGGISANGFIYDVSTLNDTNKNSLIPSVSAIDEKATEFAQKKKIVLQSNKATTGNVGASTQTRIKTSYTPESVNALNKGAEVFADTEYDPNKESVDYGATLLDAVFGLHRRRGQATPEQLKEEQNVAFIDSFGEDGFKGSNGKFYTFEDFKEHVKNKAEGRDGGIPPKIEGEFVKRYVENNFLINVGSELYTSDAYGVAVRRGDLVSTSQRKADDDDAGDYSVVSIVEDLNTQFNAITSDAEREFSKPGYKAGTTRGGEEQAPQMFNFLTNKSYMKGGSEKSIDNVEYRIVGEGEDRKILLDIFNASAGKEDKLATVDLSDTIARRDFLTNIGQGLAVTSSEKQAVREETKALTRSRELAFDVFKGLGVGEENENKWQQLAKAIRNNSSEGLNAEERKAFLKAGYGKK